MSAFDTIFDCYIYYWFARVLNKIKINNKSKSFLSHTVTYLCSLFVCIWELRWTIQNFNLKKSTNYQRDRFQIRYYNL